MKILYKFIFSMMLASLTTATLAAQQSLNLMLKSDSSNFCVKHFSDSKITLNLNYNKKVIAGKDYMSVTLIAPGAGGIPPFQTKLNQQGIKGMSAFGNYYTKGSQPLKIANLDKDMFIKMLIVNVCHNKAHKSSSNKAQAYIALENDSDTCVFKTPVWNQCNLNAKGS